MVEERAMLNDGRPGLRLTPQTIVGLLIILYGLVLTADNFGWIQAGRISFWPLVITILGATMLSRASDGSSRAVASLVLGVGLLLTGSRLFGWHLDLASLWPLVLIAIGIGIMMRAQGRSFGSGDPVSDQQISSFAFWSGTKRRVTSPLFKRADFTAVMGGIEVDLRAASPAGGEAVIDVFVVMGSVEIRVPPDWTVSNQVVAIMAGVDDKSTGEPLAKNRLVLRGFVMMGGVEVKS
jgi:predicted membrane protein